MTNPRFIGSGVALVTPFDRNGVNERVLRELVNYQIEQGTDALIMCGSTGEAATMTPDEQQQTIGIAVEAAAGRLPIIAGCGGSDTQQVMRLARNARAAGAHGVLISAPPYNKPTQQGLVAHYRAVIEAAQLPAVIYNVPGRTSVNILPATIEQIAQDERVIGVKEACGDIVQIAELARRLADRLVIWSGNDDQVLPILSLGGKGVISVLGNIAPRDTSRMVHTWLDGDLDTARALQLRYLPLVSALFAEPNPIPVKAALSWLGFDAGPVRLPLTEITAPIRERLERALTETGLEPRR
ncbi:MAG: 4-hydroxy-tetrahydrodipicolinate synthase [Gemmatimonadota bacterium]